MPYYRIKVGNRQTVIEHEGTQDEVGEIYKDRLIGECDQYGHLRDYYIAPATREALAEAAKELWSEWDVTEEGKLIRKESTEVSTMSIPLVIKPVPETLQPKYIKRYKVEYNGVPYYTYAMSMEQVGYMDEQYGADKGEWLNKPKETTPMHDPMFEAVFGESNLANVVRNEIAELESIMQKPIQKGCTKCDGRVCSYCETWKAPQALIDLLQPVDTTNGKGPYSLEELKQFHKPYAHPIIEDVSNTTKPETHNHTGADVTQDPIAVMVKQYPNLLNCMSAAMVLANMLGDLMELQRPKISDEYLRSLTKRVLSVKCTDAPTTGIDAQMAEAHQPQTTLQELTEEHKAIVNKLLADALPTWEDIREKLQGALKVFPSVKEDWNVKYPMANLSDPVVPPTDANNIIRNALVEHFGEDSRAVKNLDALLSKAERGEPLTTEDVDSLDTVPFRDRRFFRTGVFDMLVQGINGFTRRCQDKYEEKLMNNRDGGMLSPRRANLRNIAIRNRVHVEGQIQSALVGPVTSKASGIRLGYQFDNVQDNVLVISFRTRKGIVPVLTVTYDDGNFHLKHHEGI